MFNQPMFLINFIAFVSQAQAAQAPVAAPAYPTAYPSYPFAQNYAASAPQATYQNLNSSYPALSDMGLALTEEEVAMITSNAVSVKAPSQVGVPSAKGALVAPVSGSSLGLQRAQVTHGIRELVLCKAEGGKVGMRVQSISKVRHPP